ncbi:MAG: hypothetical protein L3J84_07010 [Gammaproteobacteria bacterium]|nr:hypothetical protein [Gammaproteobacteria bacterium]
MPRLLIVFSFVLLAACANQVKQNTVVLNYSDFGPQVIASEIIGMEWWQWQSHGESRPAVYDVKVVVFQDIPLKEVKRLYPVNPDRQKDYRYLKYEKALDFLNSKIDDNVLEKVTSVLVETRTKLIGKFD